ncbi:hypothetical protein [Symmachiella dynata]|uniref:hypothetical protein n=1 Tax=Symmachiella dynata TaxID=2527995 RepID=UPI00119EDC70|nr:hypothetical protein [Symmachiella dynata]
MAPDRIGHSGPQLVPVQVDRTSLRGPATNAPERIAPTSIDLQSGLQRDLQRDPVCLGSLADVGREAAIAHRPVDRIGPIDLGAALVQGLPIVPTSTVPAAVIGPVEIARVVEIAPAAGGRLLGILVDF